MRLFQCFRWIYSALLLILLPVFFIHVVWQSRRNPSKRHRWHELLGYIPPLKEKSSSIWVHAVSVGEAIAAIPLIKILQKKYPDEEIVVTCTTPTGSKQILKHFGTSITHSYLPLDISNFVLRFLKRCRPKLCIIMETEIWPNLIYHCWQNDIPTVIANARMSERSKLRYQLINRFIRQILSMYTKVAAQGLLDAERFIELGLPPQNLTITGNIKFDLILPPNLTNDAELLKQQWQLNDRPVLIAASTHEGEEKIILQAFKRMQSQFDNLLLILVPRHPKRFDKVKALCDSMNASYVSRSTGQSPQAVEVMVGDTMGEVPLLYSTSDVAFVGGSLVPIGGHNLLEPAAVGLPILTGPHLENCTETSRLLIQAGAAQIVDDADSLAKQLITIFSSESLRNEMGKKAKEVVLQNQGALKKHLEAIEPLLDPSNTH